MLNRREEEGRIRHPPACTCFECNELRLWRERAAQDRQRSAEYNRRIKFIEDRRRRRERSPLRSVRGGTGKAALVRLILMGLAGAAAAALVYALNAGIFG